MTWRGSLLLALLAFGVGVVVGLRIDSGERSEDPPMPLPAAAPSHSAAPAEILTEPAERVPVSLPSKRTDLVATEPSEPPLPSATNAVSTVETGSINVQVVDARGAPIPGAAVRKRVEVIGPDGRVVGSDNFRSDKLHADSNGRAVLPDVSFGTYRVIAETDELASSVGAQVRVSAEDPHPSVRITLTLGGEVIGELRDVYGVPAAAIQLSIHPDTRQSGPAQISLRQVYTEADGTFAFRHLPPGPYNLYTRAKGEDEKLVPAQSLEVDVVEGQTTRVQFKDISATAVQVAGQVLRNRKPLMRARVMVSGADPGRPHLMRSAETDAQGRFEVTLDEAGEYRFSVAIDGRSGITASRQTIPQVARHALVLSFGTGSISGRVLGTGGDPIPGVEVRAQSQRKDDQRQPSGGGTVTTDGTGCFTFADFPAGSYRLIASPARNGANPFEGAGQPEVIVLEPGAELRDIDLHLSSGGAVEGRVRRRDGTPAANAKIESRGSSSQIEVVATEEGAFAINGLRPGSIFLRAVSEHECSPWVQIAVTVAETARADFVVAPGTIVLVEVDDASGLVATASVTLSDGNGQTVHVATVRDGKGRTGPVPPGTYTVTALRDWRNKDGPKVESTITLHAHGHGERVLLEPNALGGTLTMELPAGGTWTVVIAADWSRSNPSKVSYSYLLKQPNRAAYAAE